MPPVIPTELDLLATAAEDLGANIAAPFQQPPRAKRTPKKASERPVFPPPALVPTWARASGRPGEGDPLFFAGAGLALLDAFLRSDPPAAGALRARLALQNAAASAKILRVNADEGALRDLRFAAETALGPAATLLSHWRDCAGRPPSLDPGRIVEAAAPAGLGSAGLERPRSQPEGLRRGWRSGLSSKQDRRPGVLRLAERQNGRSRNPGALRVRHGSSRSGSAGHGRCR
jgi:hypothetical protein